MGSSMIISLTLAVLGQCGASRATSYAQQYTYSAPLQTSYYQQQAYYYPAYKAEYFAAVVGDKLKAEQIQEQQVALLKSLTEQIALLKQTPSTVPAPVVAAPPGQVPVYSAPRPAYSPLQPPRV